MSETEKQAVETIAENIKKLEPQDVGYVMGYITAKAQDAQRKGDN